MENFYITIKELYGKADKLPLYTNEEEKEAFEKLKSGDKKIREDILLHNINLVLKIIGKFKNVMPYDDLFQTGIEGLLKAIDSYNSKFNSKFSTFAVSYIKGTILNEIAENSPFKRDYFQKIQRVKKIKNDYEVKFQKKISIGELSELTGYSEQIIKEILIMIYYEKALSLDTYISDDEKKITIEDTLVDKKNSDIEDKVILSMYCIDIVKIIFTVLTERERKIFILYNGLDGNPHLTFRELEKQMGITDWAICKTEKKAKQKIIAALEKNK